jgi:glycosyltransferase involved in cell wall biosynthesis
MKAPRTAERRVLILARHFPPIGGAGVHRTLGSVRHLPAHGYEPVVVTGPGAYEDRWSPSDEGLLGKVPASRVVHRLQGSEPPGRSGWRARADRWLQRPAPVVRYWVEHALAEGVRHGRGVDVVLASCIPYETAQAGAGVARALGVPWVADLEDPWALDAMRVQPTRLHHLRDLRQMRTSLASAAAVIMCAQEAADSLSEALPALSDRVTSIPIGYDGDDFRRRTAIRDDHAFRIVHTGSLHTELGLRHRRSRQARRLLLGTSVDVDILTRSHVFLIEAIDRLISAEPELGGRIELVLAGAQSPADIVVAGDRQYVRFVDELAHDEVVALMHTADLLFLPMHDLPPGQRARIVPYKTYEYVAAGRPILAAVPDGDARDLLLELQRASVVRPADVTAMASAIRRRMLEASDDLADDNGSQALVAALERRVLVGRIAAVLDGVLDGQPAFAGRIGAAVDRDG